MLASNLEVIKAVLKTDPTISQSHRRELLDFLANGKAAADPPPTTGPRVLRIKAVAQQIGQTPRSIHQLCKEGLLQKVSFPGRTRSAGVLESSVNALLSGGVQSTVNNQH